jgi:O-antigen ligase
MPIFIILLTVGASAYALMRYVYYKNIELFICLVVIINFDFFYLLPPVGGFYNYGITLLPVFALLLIEQLLRSRIRMDVFGVLILIYVFFLVVGIVTAFSNGQPIVLGFKAIKYQLLIFVFFIIAAQDVKLDKFTKYFIFVTVVFMLLADIDTAFFKGELIFAHASERFMGERLGKTRFVLGAAMISIACVMSFASFLKKKSKVYGVLFFIFFLHIFFVIQTRMTIIGIIVTCALLLAIVRRLSPSGMFVMVFLVSLSIPGMMLFGNFFNEIGLVKKTRTDIQSKTGSWQGRLNAYGYYWGKIAESPLFGYGYENLNWEKGTELQLRAKKIFKEDIGISHFFYENGLLGILWFIALTVALVKRVWPIKQKIPEITAFFIFSYAVLITLDYFFYRYTILFFGIFLGLLSQYSGLRKLTPEVQTG